MRLLFILLISVSVLAKLEYRNKKTLNPKLVRKSFVESKALKIIKKGNKSCFYQNDEQSYNEKKKAILKAISNLFQGPIKVEEIKNLDLNTLTVKIYDPEELYEINKAYVKYDYIFSKKEKIKIQKKLYSHVIDLDISKLSLGEHKAYFIFKIKSKKKKRWKRKSHYVFSNLDFVKTDIPNIISNLVVEPLENTPYVKLDASNSSSDGADIVSYEFITLKDGVQVDSLLSETPVVYIDFDDVGTYELQLKVTTADGFSELSDKTIHTATKTIPTLKYNLSRNQELPGHYSIDLSESYDKDGDDIILYRLTLFYNNGEDFYVESDSFYEEANINFAISKTNTEYTLRVRIYDENYATSFSDVNLEPAQSIAPKYLGHYISQDDLDPTRIYIGADYQDDSQVVEFIFTATHEDGEKLLPNDDQSFQDNNFLITKPGNWTFEMYGVDEDGLKSDVITETVTYEWSKEDLIPFYTDHYFNQSEDDERVYYLAIAFHDILGEVVSTEYKATHESGLVISGFRGAEFDNELRFPLKGNWTIQAIATDNDGFKSDPFQFTESIDWNFDNPVADVDLTQDPNDQYVIRLTENRSYPKTIETSYIKATSQNGEVFETSFDYDFFEFRLPNRGDWTVEYYFKDILGFTSNTVTKSFSIILQAPDGDIIPPHPGSRGLASLEGIDSDNDGIRDDIENFIYDRNLSGDEKRETLKYVKVMQDQMLEATDKAKSIEATRKLIDLEYCLEYTFGKERADEFLADLKVEMYASKERIRAFAYTQMNFAGQVVTLDTDEENYYKYCEDI